MVSRADWERNEVNPRFPDEPFNPEVLEGKFGYKRINISNDMVGKPYDLYDYCYGSTFETILYHTNRRLSEHNAKLKSNKIPPFTLKELHGFFGTLILSKLEKGMDKFENWYKTRLTRKTTNYFDKLEDKNISDLTFMTYTRFCCISRFITPGDIRYTQKKLLKKYPRCACYIRWIFCN